MVDTPSESKTYKPTTGDITTEVSVNLEYGTFLNGGQLRVRKFTAENKALRLGTSLDYTYSKMDAEVYSSTFGISLVPGIERHFGGTNRLSPYIGVELPIGFRTSKYETDHYTVKGSTAYNSSADRANFNIGLNGLAGVDYYVAPRFYVGFELGAGVRYNKYNDIETTFKRDLPNSSQELEGYHSISFSPFSTGGIRLGFVF
ncbi:BT1926 family outer membrane beta-barrel protein [Pontibacter sp. BAB1700]|uniref:opacity family porin n=1 Tax=Pontibacter sp. BAB1700 TaxID=1144253 RepID=UPI00026BBCCC|nr:BT1926 family outer membrane beta-barrel protein [Pontibacter sp. BAB1700]EJF11784.1 hypothetical protein O71_00947 [Pontibacter sp. BAB1700]